MSTGERQKNNHLGQPIGPPLPDWSAPTFPSWETIDGNYCRLEPLDPAQHAEALHNAFSEDAAGRNWTYLPYGPFESFASFNDWLTEIATGSDPQFYSVVPLNTDCAAGLASYLRIDPDLGCIEVGHLHFAESVKRSPVTTEAMFLMMQRAFELGYRRYEWKCDALNGPSRAAAERLGFTYEGTFRQAFIYKGRSRDTAWFSIIDSEWPAVRSGFEAWLSPENFDDSGKQRSRLRTGSG